MNIRFDPTTKGRTLNTMVTLGGLFAKSLGAAASVADPDNYARLVAAFPEIWQRYQDMGDLLAERDKEDKPTAKEADLAA